MSRRLCLLVVALGLAAAPAVAQPFRPDGNPVFDDTRLATIAVDIAPTDLSALLANPQSDQEFPVRFIFDNGLVVDTLDQVGFGLRGNTSREAEKKSFKLSFNTYQKGRKFKGLEKLNLNGEHNDPSVMRAKLAWDLYAGLAVPASRANHVRLYVNGQYYGLYLNVEHIDEQFLQSRFGDDAGNLYKCLYPADLAIIGRGNPADYRPTNNERRPYDLTQGASDAEGYGDLARFIAVLNGTPDAAFPAAIEAVFDVNGFLRVLALDVVAGNWDNYWFLKNNYYLYNNPATGRFHFIPYDYDNTFGVDFVSDDWGRKNVYNWGNLNEARPLVRRILNVPAYRRRYTFYLRRLLEGPASVAALQPRIEALRTLIAPSVAADPFYPRNYGWTADDFQRSFDGPLGGHVEYGLLPYLQVRAATALTQTAALDIEPILSGLAVSPRRPAADQPMHATVFVEDEAAPTAVAVRYQVPGEAAQEVALFDDGLHADGTAADGVYGGTIPALGRSAELRLTAVATDAAGQTGLSAVTTVSVGGAVPSLYVNEVMASNSRTLKDEAGESDDWVELYNATDAPISLAGYTLTDNFDYPAKWTFPDVVIPARGYLVVWTDGDTGQGALHASFSLDKAGEQIGLYDPQGTPVSTLTFEALDTDESFGRLPDGGEFLGRFTPATPGKTNGDTGVGTDDLPAAPAALAVKVFPNPFAAHATVALDLPTAATVAVDVWDLAGRRVRRLARATLPAGTHHLAWDGADDAGRPLPSGLYFVRLAPTDGRPVTAPVTLVR